MEICFGAWDGVSECGLKPCPDQIVADIPLSSSTIIFQIKQDNKQTSLLTSSFKLDDY